MFRLLEVVGTTAFFERTSAPPFDPHGDGWWLQNFNKNRVSTESRRFVLGRIKHRFGSHLPPWLKRALKTLLLSADGGITANTSAVDTTSGSKLWPTKIRDLKPKDDVKGGASDGKKNEKAAHRRTGEIDFMKHMKYVE